MPGRGAAWALGRRRVLPAAAALALAVVAGLAPSASALPSPGDAERFDSPCATGNDRHFVYDFVGLLDTIEGEYVESRGCDLYQEDGAHLVLAIVADLDGQSIDTYAVDLVRAWGIGDDERLDGLLVLYAMDDGSGSAAMRVEVGYGLEGVVNSLVAREAVDSTADLKRRAMENGSSEAAATAHALSSAAAGLALFTQSNHEGVAGARESSRGGSGSGGAGALDAVPWWAWLLLLAVLLTLLGAGRRGRGSGAFLGGFLLGSLFGRGGRRGGGPGGFGGGKSGGGGWGGKP